MGGIAAIIAIGGLLLSFTSSVWLLILACSVSLWSGLLYLFLPVYSLYFMISRWNDREHPTARPGNLYLAGIGLFILGVILGAAA